MYSRQIDDQILSLVSSGWTYKNTFVLYDRETESLWYHLGRTRGLTCISGSFADRKLEEFTSFFIRWALWKQMQPDSKFMKYPR